MARQTFLDGALIAGDLGCFPNAAKQDKATRRWIAHDPEEGGFSTYFVNPDPTVQAMMVEDAALGPFSAVKCPILFTAGNHEDYAFLESKSKQGQATGAPPNTFPVDCYGCFHAIQNGAVTKLTGADGSHLRVAAIWGIENSSPGKLYRMSQTTVENLILTSAGEFDLLLTHDAPFEAYPNLRGSPLIRDVIQECQPAFHLFGHVHTIDGRHEYNVPGTSTRSWLLENVTFGKNLSRSLTGSLAILEWDGKKGNITLVQDVWLSQMRFHTWASIWPEGV